MTASYTRRSEPPAHASGGAGPAATVAIQWATYHDLRRLGHVIADAFADLDQNLWLVPDPEMRPYVLPAYFALQVELGLRSGVVYTTSQRNAVAIWHPVAGRLPSLPDYDERMARIAGRLTNRFHAFEAALANHHPVLHPHHWLAFLAVAPDHQGSGIGSHLIEHHHRILDEGGIAGYLDAANLRSRDFCRRLGWLDHTDPFPIAANGPVTYPLWRDARRLSERR